jgi:YVTN family beta-propeller protein
MRRFRWVFGVLVLGLSGALVGVVPAGVSAVATRSRCRATAFVTNSISGTVSTIDVKTRTKHPTDIPVGTGPFRVAFTPNGKTAFVTNNGSGTVSTIDVKTRTGVGFCRCLRRVTARGHPSRPRTPGASMSFGPGLCQ